MSKKNPVAQPDGVRHAAPEVPAAAPPPQEVAGGNGNGEAKNPPATVVRHGRVKVAVWTNYSRNGRPYYSTTVSRVYRTEDGYGQATSFDRGDLLVLAEALREALHWISTHALANGDDDVPF